ncbi:unnamed protein product [Ectocarpus sp. 8 AP-2014]
MSTDCIYACSADADETCGGYYAATVYYYSGRERPDSGDVFRGVLPHDERDACIMEFALIDRYSMTKDMCESERTERTHFGLQYGRETSSFCGGDSTYPFEESQAPATTNNRGTQSKYAGYSTP